MSEARRRVACVIVAHGNVAECLMDGIQGILGKQSGWVAVSNRGLGLKELKEAVSQAIVRLRADLDVIVFSDMPGGSCHHACQELMQESAGIRLITGLNLMMLLEFFVKRDSTELKELVNLIMDRGRDSIRLV